MSDFTDLLEKEAKEKPVLAIPAGDAALAELSAMVETWQATGRNLEAAEAEVARLKAEVDRYEQQLLPEKMTDLGFQEFTTASGVKLKVERGIAGSITKARADDAHQWLRDHGYDDIIKNVVSVRFGRGEDAEAEGLLAELQQRGTPGSSAISVPAPTLKAFLKMQILEQGNPLFMSEDVRKLFGVYEYKRAKVAKK